MLFNMCMPVCLFTGCWQRDVCVSASWTSRPVPSFTVQVWRLSERPDSAQKRLERLYLFPYSILMSCNPSTNTICFVVISNLTTGILWFSSTISSACTSEVEKVCKVSDEDNLQPFKENMEDFLLQGNWQNLWMLQAEQGMCKLYCGPSMSI